MTTEQLYFLRGGRTVCVLVCAYGACEFMYVCVCDREASGVPLTLYRLPVPGSFGWRNNVSQETLFCCAFYTFHTEKVASILWFL